MIDIIKLKSKIAENNRNIEMFSKKIGMNKSTLYRKLYGANGETLLIKEVKKIAEELNLTKDDVMDIFFREFFS